MEDGTAEAQADSGRDVGVVVRAQWRPERVFALLAAAFGLLFLLITPPLAPPDENRHLARTYLISQGHFAVPGIAQGRAVGVPRSLLTLHRRLTSPGSEVVLQNLRREDLLALLRQPLAPEDRLDAGSLSVYSPVAYAPQAVGVWIGRRLGLAPAALVYLGRAFNAAAWTAAATLAIALMPIRRWTLFLLCLMPMSVFQASSLSPDALTSALALLFVASVMRLACVGAGPLSTAQSAAVLTLSALLGLAKPGYWPLVAIVLVLPAHRFRSPGRRLGFASAVVAAALVPGSLWLMSAIASGFELPLTSGVDPSQQLRLALGQPLRLLGVLVKTLAEGLGFYLRSFVGVLGRLDVHLPALAYPVYGIALFATSLFDGRDPAALTPTRRATLAIVFLVCTASVMTLAYVSWNAVAAPLVHGLQGRYFFPMAPLLFLALPSRRIVRLERVRPALLAVLSSLTLGVATQAILERYYSL